MITLVIGVKNMIIGTGTIHMKADWCHSLKEKRMVVQSIVQKVRNKFNVSISEIEDLDMHNSIVIGFAVVTNDTRYANSVVQKVLDFIEDNTEAVVIDSNIETI